jgi:proteasome accessory factor B
MSDATERLVNLALFMADTPEPVTAAEVRERVEGYPADQDEDAFLRMFERDKKELRASGLAMETVELPRGRAYRLDRDATFQQEFDLGPAELAILRAVGTAFAADASFPFRDALGMAMAKIGAAAAPAPGVSPAVLADEDPHAQGSRAGELAGACVTRKRASFSYVDATGRSSERTVEPFGLFLREGRWYLVARDVEAAQMRVFAVRRMGDLSIESRKPGTPDFDVPEGFEASQYARLPFQYGHDRFDARIAFDADVAWRAPYLTEGRGTLADAPDGAMHWTVEALDAHRLGRWVVESGPGIRLLGPPDAVNVLREGLEEAVRLHG